MNVTNKVVRDDNNVSVFVTLYDTHLYQLYNYLESYIYKAIIEVYI